jgi:hypothetical protein
MTTGVISNIIHKVAIRVANLTQLAGGFKESNRHRVGVNITADAADKSVFVAPWDGSLESLIVSSPTASTSTGGNHVTLAFKNITTGVTIATYDTLTNTFELLQNRGVELDLSGAISPSLGTPVSTFKKYDLLAIRITVTGAPGPTSASVMPTVFTIYPTDPKVAF